jgi:hypothetical protein
VLVGNTELGSLVSIPIRPDGAASPARVIKSAGALAGVDGIALDVHGTVYAATRRREGSPGPVGAGT